MRMAGAAAALWCLGLVAGAGCGHEPRLVPGRSAERMAEVPSAAVAEAGGVRFAVEGDAWPDRSVPLAHGVTPVLVMIENRGDAPVMVRHDDFALARESGERFTALAPDEVPISSPSRPAMFPEPVFSPGDPARRVELEALSPGPNPTMSLGPRETSFPYNHLYVRGVTVAPPSRQREPLVRALPEGTLARGQRSAGFLYFEGAVGSERRLVFEARLAKQGAPGGRGAGVNVNVNVDVALAKIPMRVQ